MDASMDTQNEMSFQFLDLHDLTDNDKGQLLNLLKTDTKTLKLPWKKVMKKNITATKAESQQHHGCNIMTYPLMTNEWQYNVSNDQVPTFVPRIQYGHTGFNLNAQFQDVNYNQENGQCNTPDRDMRRGVQSGYLNEPMQVYPQMFMYYPYPPNHSVSTQHQVTGGQIYYSAPIYSSLPQQHPNTQTVSSNSNTCPTYLPSHNLEPINNYVQHELSQPSNSEITKPMPQIVPHNGCVENTSIPNKPVCHQVNTNSHNTSQVAIVNSSISKLSVKNENTANIENVCVENVNMKEQYNTACTVNNNCKRKPEVKTEKVNVPYVNTVSNSIKTEQNGELEKKLEISQNGEIDRNLNDKIVFGTPVTTKISSESVSKVDKDVVQNKENIASKDSQNKTVTISNGSSNSSSSTSSTPSAVTPPATTVRSYASLFRKNSTESVKTPRKPVDQQNGSIRTPTQKEESTSPNTSENQSNASCIVNDCKSLQNETLNLLDDPNTFRMAEHLTSYKMDTQTVSLLPRGLTNRSSYCYINSILQALLACPPFYNLFNSLPVSKNKNKNASTYLIDNMIKFVREFSPLTEAARMPRKDRKDQRREDIDIYSGVAFEPSYIYAILKHKSFNGVFSVEGRQEDAEEFLSCLLNGINDEMTEIMKFINGHSSVATENNINGDHGHDEEEWQVMGPKNKGSITREVEFEKTPLSDIFRGQLRSRVSRAGEQPTDNVQPFFTLQLDVQKADSVRSAFEILVGKDQLEGMTSSKTRQQIEAWKQVTLEKLPAVLILHLKWFVYNNDNYANGCLKILKNMEFPVDLKIDNKFLSPNTAKKLSPKQKQYKLFAVTYHDGRETTKGHYFTDVFHVGFGCWLRYDDSTVKTVPESSVLRPSSPRVPYLLYYRRADTIGNQTANTKAQ